MADGRHAGRREVLAGIGSGLTALMSGCGTQEQSDDEGLATATESTEKPDDEGNGTETNSESNNQETASESPELVFSHPESVRRDEQFDIAVEGLPPQTTVDIVFETEDSQGTRFESRATIRTDDGEISLSDAALVGDYRYGTVPQDLDVPLPLALIQFAVPASRDSYSFPEESTPTYRIETQDETLGRTRVSRTIAETSSAIEPDHPNLSGYVYEPVDQETGPAVLLLHGSGGRAMTERAAMFARHGYTAFALEYFGAEGLPETLAEVPLEYVETAGEWIRDYRTVDGSQVGLYGASKGGELALLAASTYDLFGPVVSIAGSGVVFEGLRGQSFNGSSSWSHGGEAVPYISVSGTGGVYMAAYQAADSETKERATIPVEEIDSRVLLVSGTEDSLWSSVELQQIAADRLEEDNNATVDHLVYEEAGHFIRPPYIPLTGALGSGTLTGHAVASHEHWPEVLDTLSTLN